MRLNIKCFKDCNATWELKVIKEGNYTDLFGKYHHTVQNGVLTPLRLPFYIGITLFGYHVSVQIIRKNVEYINF